MNKTRVLYVEDDLEWRQGLANYFFNHEKIEIYASVSSIEECFNVLKSDPPDIVVMDIILEDDHPSGLDATLDITIQFPNVKVIMLSSLDENDEIFNEAFLNGAYDYLYKYDFEKLPEIIDAALSNLISKYGDRLRKLVFEKKKSLISNGDQQLLLKLLEGKTQAQIAEELHISLSAVKKHVGRIMKKFNWTGTSSDLALKCSKWGLLEDVERDL